MKYTVKYTANIHQTAIPAPLNVDPLFRWLRLLPLLFIVVGAVIGVVGIRQLMRAHASQAWPAVTGVVTISELGKHLGDEQNDSTTYSADISYDYTVNDRAYVNSTVNLGAVQTSDPALARLILKRYPVGQVVQVYYNPADPGDALLEPGVHSGTWFLPIFGALFCAVGVGVFVFLQRVIPALAETA